MPANAPDGDVAGEFRSGWASNQTSAVSPFRAAWATAAAETAQSPPIVTAGPSISPSTSVRRSRTSCRELNRAIPVLWSSPASRGTATSRVAPAGRSSRIAAAPSAWRIARDDGEPCHWGTTTKVTAMVTL